MDFRLTEEHKMVEKMVYAFARKEIIPIIKDHDRNHTYPMELIPQIRVELRVSKEVLRCHRCGRVEPARLCKTRW